MNKRTKVINFSEVNSSDRGLEQLSDQIESFLYQLSVMFRKGMDLKNEINRIKSGGK